MRAGKEKTRDQERKDKKRKKERSGEKRGEEKDIYIYIKKIVRRKRK